MNPSLTRVGEKKFYVVGGTLRHDAPSYIERQADRELFDSLSSGELCYVLTARQMGKSSLMIRTAEALRKNGIIVAVLDLTAIGQNLTIEQWYCGLLLQIGQRLDLEDELLDFWQTTSHLGAMQRWLLTLRTVVLPQNSSSLVIFIDEIDAVRSLPFKTDEFFAGIRECHNLRSEDPVFERLTFCLLGVATPADLIQDTRTTPFNIGQRVDLNDFTETEAMSLAQGMNRELSLGMLLLQRILYWTNGHPFLTQRLCEAVAHDLSIDSISKVDQICQDLFLVPGARDRDDNLLFVRERILRSEADLTSLLDFYRLVRRGKAVSDDPANQLAGILRLSGITRSDIGKLKIRNRIYEHVFNPQWIDANIPNAELRRQRAAYRKGIFRTTLLSTIIVAVVGWLAFEAFRQGNIAKKENQDNQRLIYWSNFNLAQQELEKHQNISRANELLLACIPSADHEDLRNFEWHYLWHQTHQEEWASKSKNEIFSVSFSPTTKRLTLAERIRMEGGARKYFIRTIDTNTRKEISSFETPAGVYHNWTVFTPDKLQIATDDPEHKISLWNLETKSQSAILSGHAKPLTAITFSPDGKWLVSCDMTPTLKIWDVSTAQEKFSFALENSASAIAFTPDNQHFLLADNTNKMRTWDVASGRELASFSAENNEVEKAAFFPDGHRLLISSNDRTISIWDYQKRKKLQAVQGHNSYLSAIEFSPDGQHYATASSDRTVKIWSAVNGQVEQTITGHGSSVSSIAWMQDSKHIFTSSQDQFLKLWNLEKLSNRSNLTFDKFSASWATTFTSNQQLLALCKKGNQIMLFNLTAQLPIATLPVNPDTLLCAKFSPDNKFVVTGDSESHVNIWDVQTGHLISSMVGLKDAIYNVRFSPDSKQLVTGGAAHEIRIYDVTSGRQTSNLKTEIENSYCAEFSPDGKILAFATQDGSVNLWNLQNNSLIRRLYGHLDVVIGIAFSSDSRLIVTAGMDKTMRLWDVNTGQEIKNLGQTDMVQRIVFSPDNKRLVTGGREGTVKIWDLQSGQEALNFEGLKAEVRSVTFSPDGFKLAFGGADDVIRILEATPVGNLDSTINK